MLFASAHLTAENKEKDTIKPEITNILFSNTLLY
jgi:hypothetical protein